MYKLNYFLLFLVVAVMGNCCANADQCSDEFTVLLAGDAIITQPWSDNKNTDFLRLIKEIRSADVAIANLEVVVHTYKGYAQAQSGGVHLSARPAIANELAWAGFDMVCGANNHTFDYGSIGTLETIQHTQNAGLIIAGAGKDLQEARLPKYFKSGKTTVTMVSTTSSFQPYGMASRSRPDIHGRPGPNPLTIIKKDNEYSVKSCDKKANLDAVKTAAQKAGCVIMAVHWHHHDMKWLQQFAQEAIDAGADIVFCHGPHEIKPIEIYKNKPIFYSLGDFVFQNEQVEKFPVELYDKFGLGDDAKPIDLIKKRYKNYTTGFPTQQKVWEGLLAKITFKKNSPAAIELIPMDLRFKEPAPPRGLPIYASQKLGKEIITYAKEVSKAFKTEIQYVEETNTGYLSINSNK